VWQQPTNEFIEVTMRKLLFVDYENVPKVELAGLPADVVVPFFFGASQRTVPTAFLKEALKLGERFVPIDIEGQGKNALDFHIAYYLGEYLKSAPDADCVILSRDKGFDPLVRHLCGRGFKVRRVGAPGDAFGSAAPAPARPRAKRAAAARPGAQARTESTHAARHPDFDRAVDKLRRMPARNLPQRRKALAATLHSAFARRLDASEIEHLIDSLILAGRVRVTGTALSYALD
jgi:hypothetical protein